jgi:hypothetical protein
MPRRIKMIDCLGIKNIWPNISIVYKIYLRESYVFMRINKTPHENEDRYIAIVDSKRFYEKWTGKSVEQCIIADEFEQRKYTDAIDGFLRGIGNPVPLAEVSFGDKISFTDGITRTKWLIIHGALCFPIECDKYSAERFKTIVYKNNEIKTVAEIIKEQSPQNK